MLGLHLQGPVGIGGTAIQEHSAEARLRDRAAGPEVGGEERHRAFEIPRVQEERPGLVPGRDVLAGGGGLGRGERKRQVAIAEQLAAGALLEIQAIGRPQQPGAELRDAVFAFGLVPVSSFPGPGSVGPLAEIRRHAAHDELRRLRGILRVAPPAQAALDVGIEFDRRRQVHSGRTSRCRTGRFENVAPDTGPTTARRRHTWRTRRCRFRELSRWGRGGSRPSRPSESRRTPEAMEIRTGGELIGWFVS